MWESKKVWFDPPPTSRRVPPPPPSLEWQQLFLTFVSQRKSGASVSVCFVVPNQTHTHSSRLWLNLVKFYFLWFECQSFSVFSRHHQLENLMMMEMMRRFLNFNMLSMSIIIVI
jgi:hypothetical protein